MKKLLVFLSTVFILFGCATYEGPKLSEVMAQQCYGINVYDQYTECITREWLSHVKLSKLYNHKVHKNRVDDFELRMKELRFAIKNGVMSEAEAILKLGEHRRELANEENRSNQNTGATYQYTPPQSQSTNCISNRIGTQVITNCY